MLWDIFCRVIDNFGDIGVCWRLSADLARRGERVRLWVDDASALAWMAPGALEGRWPRVQVQHWSRAQDPSFLADLAPSDVWIEAFGCDVPAAFITAFANAVAPGVPGALGATKQPVWLNLEYLSAEPYVERSHLLASPVMSGPAKGWKKTFFYPGFTTKTGGLLREAAWSGQRGDSDPAQAAQWRAQRSIEWRGERLISLFCYEPPALAGLLEQLAHDAKPTLLLVTPGRATQAVRSLMEGRLQQGSLRLHYLDTFAQAEFDPLLAMCDLNFVRGEDSLIRALWAGKPLVWHIYPQDDGAHIAKLDAFMDVLKAPASMRSFHRHWNPSPGGAPATPSGQDLPLADLSSWQAAVRTLRTKLLQMDDLTSQVLQFAAKNR